MPAISGSVDPDEILTLGPASRRVVISQSAYIPPFYHIRIHRQIQDDTTETQIVYAGRNLVVEGSVLVHSAGLSFLSSEPG